MQGQATQKYASEACRKRAARDALSAPTRPDARADASGDVGETERAVRAELERASRESSYLGASALALAQRVDQSTAVMGFAALVKELRATMDAAMQGARVERSSLDELRERRDAKRGA